MGTGPGLLIEPFTSERGTSGLWVELGLKGLRGWRVAALFLQRGGTDVLVELRVLPTEDDDDSDNDETAFGAGEWSREVEAIGPHGIGITARHLRAVSLVDLERVVPGAADLLSGAQGRLARRAQRTAATPERPGRAGRDPAYYAAWAQRYVEALPKGAPIKTLAMKYGLRESQVRDVIHQARVRGFLTQGRQGRAGGALTDAARTTLRAPRRRPTTTPKEP